MKPNVIYFVSDIHLKFEKSDEETEKQRLFLDFLQSVEKKGSALYILGDLFDFWFEWRHVIPAYWSDILFQLKKMISGGVAVHFITGNHDFHFSKYLSSEIGMICHHENTEFSQNGKRFFLAHGDGYAKNDRGYRLLKRVIRSRFAKFMFKTFIHPDFGMWIADKTSKTSGKHRREDSTWEQEYFLAAEKKFEQGFDYVLFGHLHKGVRIEKGNCIYINCGNWIRDFSYARYNGTELGLHYFKEKKTKTP